MKLRNNIFFILIAALALGFLHCGSSGSGTNALNFSDLNGTQTGLYVVSSAPSDGSYYVSQTTNVITLRMSEDVTQSTLAGGIQLVSNPPSHDNNASCGGTPVTGFNTSVNGAVITMQNSAGLVNNTNYEIQVFPTLAATSGDLFMSTSGQFSCFYIDFSTGAGNNGLGQSVNGPPTVVSVSNSYPGYFLIQFDESLAYAPTVVIEYRSSSTGTFCIGSGAIRDISVPMGEITPATTGGTVQWVVPTLIPSGDICPASSVYVKVSNYVDLDQGLTGQPYTSQGFPNII